MTFGAFKSLTLSDAPYQMDNTENLFMVVHKKHLRVDNAIVGVIVVVAALV